LFSISTEAEETLDALIQTAEAVGIFQNRKSQNLLPQKLQVRKIQPSQLTKEPTKR
jgi:hypothetical protein